jgi:hypothetical protein
VTLRQLNVLQWFGVAAAALVWAGQLVLGFGVTQAECNAGAVGTAIGNDAWQLTLLSFGVFVAVGAEAAAATVFLRTRGSDADDPPPEGRLHFLAAAALVANLLFLTGIVLAGTASVAGVLCRGG